MSDPLSPDQLEAVRRKRQASLLKKWLEGGRLHDSEVAEIAHLVPPDVLAKPPPAPGAARGSYRESQAVYAARYSTAVRTIKLWINQGRSAGEPPPLDDPQAMPDWWTRRKSNRVPLGILSAAGVGTPPSPPAPIAETAPSIESPPDDPPPSRASPELGYAASLARLRSAEADAHSAYETAKRTKGNDGQIDQSKVEQARRAWNEISEQLRFQEAAAAKVLSASGDLLPRDEIKRQLVELHAPIVAGLRSLFNRVRTKAGNIPLEQARPHFDAEIRRLLDDLCRGPFAPAA